MFANFRLSNALLPTLLLITIAANSAFIRTNAVTSSRTIMMKSTDQIPTSNFDSSNKLTRKISTAAALLFPLLSFTNSAKAGLFVSAEQELVNSLAIFQKPVYDLLEQLRPGKNQILKGGVEDSNVVQQNVNIYIIPMQAKMAEVASKLNLQIAADQTRVELLPLLMKGHILELTQAIEDKKAESQFKEVEEVQETHPPL